MTSFEPVSGVRIVGWAGRIVWAIAAAQGRNRVRGKAQGARDAIGIGQRRRQQSMPSRVRSLPRRQMQSPIGRARFKLRKLQIIDLPHRDCPFASGE